MRSHKVFYTIIVTVALGFTGCSTYQKQLLPTNTEIKALQKKHLSSTDRMIPAIKSLSDIAMDVISNNPDLIAMRQDLNISDALVLSTGLLSDPSVGLSLGTPFGVSGLYNALDMGINWSLASLFTRSIEVDRAQYQRNALLEQYRWQVRLRVANALVLAGRLYYYTLQNQIIAKNLALSQTLYAVTQTKTLLNDETALTQNSRKAILLDTLDSKNKMDEQIVSTRQEMNYLLGLPPSALFNIAPFEPLTLAPDPEVLFDQAIEKRHDLIALKAAYESSDAFYRRNLLAQFPSFSIGVNWSRDTSKVHTIGPSVSFDLPLWNRNKGGIALSSALREKEKESYAAALARVQSDIVILSSTYTRTQQLYQRGKVETALNHKLEKRLHDAYKSSNISMSDYAIRIYEISAQEMWMSGLKQSLFEQQIALSLSSGSNEFLGEKK